MVLTSFYSGRLLVTWFCRLAYVLIGAIAISSCGDEDYIDEVIEENREFLEQPNPRTRTPNNRLREWEVAEFLYEAGFKDEEVHQMVCIARYESGLKSKAIGRAATGQAKGSKDIGLFQINTHFWAKSKSKGGCGISEADLFDPSINARCARMVYERHGFDGWVAYKRNRATCQRYLADLRKPPSSSSRKPV
jgi:hypothetical protein